MRPMLGYALAPEDLGKLRYPLLSTPKVDGIRCVVQDDKAYSRSLKLIPNQWIQQELRDCSSLDGELIVVDATFNETSSWVRRRTPAPVKWQYLVFDFQGKGSYRDRHAILLEGEAKVSPVSWWVLKATEVNSPEEVEAIFASSLASGWEGIVLRDPAGLYKPGRSTLREQGMLKMKAFTDEEVRVKGFDELEHNLNPQQINELGLNDRSSHQANMIPGGCLGALVVCKQDGTIFRVGTGFTQAERTEIWRHRDRYMNQLCTIKHMPHGAKDKPRHPVFIRWRPQEVKQ